MPFTCKVRPSEEFQPGSFYREEDKADNEKTIIVEYGKIKDSEETDIHQVLYEPDDWTWDEAEEHCSSLDGWLTEPEYANTSDVGYSQVLSELDVQEGRKEQTMATPRRVAILDTIDPLILLDLMETVDDNDEYEVRINTYGGDLFAALAFMSILKDKNVTAYVDGVCASAGTVISSKANRALMNKDGFLFIHNPFSFMIGDYRTMEEESKALEKASSNLANMYAAKSKATGKNVDAKTFREMMDNEKWLSGEEALELGLVDELFDKPLENTGELINRVRNMVKRNTQDDTQKAQEENNKKAVHDTVESDYIEKKLKTLGVI